MSDGNIIHIRNMVCPRCIKAVKQILSDLHISTESVSLGEVVLSEPLSGAQRRQLYEILKEEGFELLDDGRTVLINKIKTMLIEIVRYDTQVPAGMKLSEYLSRKLGRDYSYMSNLFTNIEGCTIEKYFIRLRIERVKELLVYDELSLSEIAYKLNFSSVAHLSSQFKKETGISPSAFKKLSGHERLSLDKIVTRRNKNE
ncbi:MAG: AraC family transcriptional regulator [Bacteroidales bacterium]|nr:AraC family transcriptional regulator [Bacteroidales bacterium]